MNDVNSTFGLHSLHFITSSLPHFPYDITASLIYTKWLLPATDGEMSIIMHYELSETSGESRLFSSSRLLVAPLLRNSLARYEYSAPQSVVATPGIRSSDSELATCFPILGLIPGTEKSHFSTPQPSRIHRSCCPPSQPRAPTLQSPMPMPRSTNLQILQSVTASGSKQRMSHVPLSILLSVNGRLHLTAGTRHDGAGPAPFELSVTASSRLLPHLPTFSTLAEHF